MSKNLFAPDWAYPPGDTICEILREQKLTVGDFARRINFSIVGACKLLAGDVEITAPIAETLAAATDVPAEFWLHRERDYREVMESRKPQAEGGDE